MKIYKIEHSCGFGPLNEKFYINEQIARKDFSKIATELRRKDNFIKGSYEASDPNEFEKKDGMILKGYFKTEIEYNNENGHEFDERDEFLVLTEVEVIEKI